MLVFFLSCEPDQNYVEQISISLWRIVETMGRWFTPEDIGYSPALVPQG